MPKTPSERLEQLVRLLTEITGHPDPDSQVHKSPLLPEEKSLVPTVAVLAARYPDFNAQGLGFDLPGTGDWPDIIRVGIGGRDVGAAAIEGFFGLSRGLADRVMKERPSPALLEMLARHLGRVLVN